MARCGIEGEVRIHDSSVSVWEEPGTGRYDGAYERGFRGDVFHNIIRVLRGRGWKVGRDERIWRDYRCLNESHRYCVHPCKLEAKLEQSGRHIGSEMFQNVANVDHPHGGEYDRGKLARMPYPMRLRARAEMDALSGWLCEEFGYGFKPDERKCGPGGLTNEEWIAQNWATSRFEGGRPDPYPEQPAYNSRARDCTLRDGMRVYFTDGKGRWMAGIAEHNINNMWWVKWGRYGLRNVHSGALQERPPEDPRRKDNGRLRRERLERLMREAADANDFLRAEQLKRVLFGDRPVYRVRHRQKGWYGVQSSGYAASRSDAGQYHEWEIGFALERPEDFEIEEVTA